MTRVKIAAVSYLNTIPFIYGIEQSGVGLSADLLLSVPSKCADNLENGLADIALVPVARIPSLSKKKDISLVTPFCIGASKSVHTVALLSNSPVKEIKTVFLDQDSNTSVELIKILARELWQINPKWQPISLPLPENMVLGDAYLLIGDKVFEHESRFKYRYDLADCWRELTGMPFVFAAWVACRDVSAESIDKLSKSLDYGVHHIKDAIKFYNYHKGDAYKYLTENIDFDFDPAKQKALDLFLRKIIDSNSTTTPG